MNPRFIRQMSALAFGVWSLAAHPLASQERPTFVGFDTIFEMGLPGDPVEFFHIARVKVDADGILWALDNRALLVHKIRLDGTVLSFGGSGSGPGEFIAPVAISVDSVVRVYDGVQQRVSLFDRDGQHLVTTRLEGPTGFMAHVIVQLPNQQAVASRGGRYAPGRPGHDPRELLVWWRLSEPAKPDTLSAYHSGAGAWRTSRDAYGITSTPFGAGGAWAVSGDSILVVADGYEGSIEWFRISPSGERPSSFAIQTISEVSREITKADQGQFIDKAVREEEGIPRGAAWTFPPRWSVASALLLDESHGAWVRHAEEPTERWSVVRYNLGSGMQLILPEGFALKAVSGDLLVGVLTSPLGLETIQVLRHREEPPEPPEGRDPM